MVERLHGNSRSCETQQTRNMKLTVTFMYVTNYPHTVTKQTVQTKKAQNVASAKQE